MGRVGRDIDIALLLVSWVHPSIWLTSWDDVSLNSRPRNLKHANYLHHDMANATGTKAKGLSLPKHSGPWVRLYMYLWEDGDFVTSLFKKVSLVIGLSLPLACLSQSIIRAPIPSKLPKYFSWTVLVVWHVHLSSSWYFFSRYYTWVGWALGWAAQFTTLQSSTCHPSSVVYLTIFIQTVIT